MKVTTFFLFAMFFQVSAAVFSQNSGLISLKAENESVREILLLIEDQSKYRFLYNSNNIDVEQKKSIDCQAKSIEEVLDLLFKGTGIKYRSFERNYVLYKGHRDLLMPPRDLVTSSQQERTVSGKVTDSDGQPLPGVTIVVKGTTQGTVTNANGEYSLTDLPDDAILVFSFVGMRTQEVVVGSQTSIDVTMEEDVIGIEEVVAIGYGTQQKRDLTGAVGSVRLNEEINSRSVADFGQLMLGKVSGLNIISGSGRPGQSSTIQIRGVKSISAGGSPLIVIDGVSYPHYNLTSLSSIDIESIDILKDAASASIYGARGANGIILITTKTGKRAETAHSKFTINHTFSIQEVIRKIDVMNASEYAQAAIDASQTGWIEQGGDPNAPNTIEARGKWKYTWPEVLEHPEDLADTDFQDVIYRVAPMNRTDISFFGGDKNSSYRLSASYLDQKGIAITSHYNRYTTSMMAETKVNDRINFGDE
jgi:TonB-dependent starch-binding outer membrane protein SusC